ncbi:hypothetical protein BO86DRAFT_66860 [Aspergillus japonicus CBS 114.51]|uniref:Uncharacterized protein n=1 Tax=Aspergillus japonicus CBS 114.51 TaxID=1448312 RepID=A0A8T8X5D9_ASPJA|nr:hypothetical protein BO86DRAFT_66860 [Aspergillus japonicus CBS 114.51]RAH82699.1 hypothetical protein BO86DRAFT_66860 [Aspergillus japonicus CBS 114.51]
MMNWHIELVPVVELLNMAGFLLPVFVGRRGSFWILTAFVKTKKQEKKEKKKTEMNSVFVGNRHCYCFCRWSGWTRIAQHTVVTHQSFGLA